MKVQIEIAVNGQVYRTKPDYLEEGWDLEDAANVIYNSLDKAASYKSPLEDGGILVLGGDAMRNAAFKFIGVSVYRSV